MTLHLRGLYAIQSHLFLISFPEASNLVHNHREMRTLEFPTNPYVISPITTKILTCSLYTNWAYRCINDCSITEKPDPGFQSSPGFPGTFDWEPKSDPASTNKAPETNRQIGNLYSAVASP